MSVNRKTIAASLLSFCMLIAALAFALQLPVDMTKGSHLFGACQTAVRMSNDPTTSQAKTELPSRTYCFGYLGGYTDGLNRLDKSVCLDGASLNTIAQAYVTYMQRCPKLMDEPRYLGALLALKSSFPCATSPANQP